MDIVNDIPNPAPERPMPILDTRTGRFFLGLGCIASVACLWLTGIVPQRGERLFGSIFIPLGCLWIVCLLWKTWIVLARIGLLVLAFSLSLLVADSVLRWMRPMRIYQGENVLFTQWWPGHIGTFRYRPNVDFEGDVYGELGLWQEEGRASGKRRMRFSTDAWGFPNAREDLSQAYDMIVVGDSYSVGSGTPREETWVQLLRRERSLAIYNLSVPGGPWQGYIHLLSEKNRLACKPGAILLLVLFSGNDLDDYLGPFPQGLRIIEPGPWIRTRIALENFRKRSAIRQIAQQRIFAMGGTEPWRHHVISCPFLRGETILFRNAYVQRRHRTSQEILNHPNWPRLLELLARFNEVAEIKAMELRVVLAPSKAEIYDWVLSRHPPWSTIPDPSDLSSLLERSCQGLGIPFLDLKPFFLKEARITYESAGSILWWFDDTHWDARGHDLASRTIGPFCCTMAGS